MTIAKYWLAATIPSVMICLFKTKKTAAFGSSVRHYSVVTEGNPGSYRHELMGVTWRFLSLFIKQNSHVIYKQIVQNTLPFFTPQTDFSMAMAMQNTLIENNLALSNRVAPQIFIALSLLCLLLIMRIFARNCCQA